MIKKVLFAGDYDKEYNRTKIISKGLEDCGVDVIHFVFKKQNNKTKQLIRDLSKGVDLIFLPSFTHRNVRFVKRASNKPILFDPLISRYLTKVFDFKKVSKYSPRAYKNYLKDKIAFKYADIIIADTEEHKRYFNNKFNIPNNKIDVIPVGSDCAVFYPTAKIDSGKFVVGFYGGFIPLQGITNIIETAKILSPHKDITFRIIGNGFEYPLIEKLILKKKLSNVELKGWLKYDMLPEAINEFDICLGIFGDTPKADKVIPNKIFHYAACKKAIITKDTPGIKEIFEDKKNIILTSSNPQDISEAILYAKNNVEYSNRIAESAFVLISENYNAKLIAGKVIQSAQKLI